LWRSARIDTSSSAVYYICKCSVAQFETTDTYFADDTNQFCSNNDLQPLLNMANDELLRLSEWFRANKLSINVKKNNFILFVRRSKGISCQNFKISIDNTIIERVTHAKFLGVFIDEDLL